MIQQRVYKRKILNFSVNRALQLRMIGRMTCILLVCLLISSGAFYYYADQRISASFLLFHVKARNFLDFLFPVVGFSFVFSVIAGTIASLFLPKNIAGPLYRIEEDVRRMAEGDLTVRINLRSGDEGGSLAGKLNQMIELFRGTISEVQDSVRQAQEICSIEGAEANAETQVKLQSILARISQKTTRFKVREEK